MTADIVRNGGFEAIIPPRPRPFSIRFARIPSRPF